jgi:hypothetical protein
MHQSSGMLSEMQERMTPSGLFETAVVHNLFYVSK